MSINVDVLRLIAEVKKRPALWDNRYGENKGRVSLNHLWWQVAQTLNVEVEQCKRKWKNLRDAYRAEIRRTVRRNGNYKCKWIYFELMSFIDGKPRRRDSNDQSSLHLENNSSSLDNNVYDSEFHSFYDIKMEPQHNVDDNIESVQVDDDDTANDILFEEFQTVATPQAARRLSASISHKNPLERNAQNNVSISVNEDQCRCSASERSHNQVHFLENLEKEEQKLIQSTRQDITRAQGISHVGDGDYNFLVSFLPQMKKMSEYQNLQFRAKMCELVLNIMTPTNAEVKKSDNSGNTVTSFYIKQGENPTSTSFFK
uniref:MADF domain-containing protein n=1 Tax=Glossina palpalis gambiensis TaxID=67801 RepID=A0A1B0AQ66_9MUSC